MDSNKSSKNLFERYVSKECLSGLILLFFTLLALIIANSSIAQEYHEFWEMPFGLTFSEFKITMSLTHWIDDGLMALFFLMVGLEIKRELLYGELNSLKKAAFPAVAAIGGMIVPASIYVAINLNSSTIIGFGIPMATDIAFALGVMTLLGSRVSLSLKVFLVSLAIVDDIGAVLVIATVYTSSLKIEYLLYSLVVIAILYMLNQKEHRYLGTYLFLGIILWILIHKSGVHATISGVILALFVPLKSKINEYDFVEYSKKDLDDFLKYKDENPLLTHKQHEILENIIENYERVQSPLIRLEHILHPISAFIIMPLFAFSNAGVTIGSGIFEHLNIFLGILLGLVVGKPLGIFGFTYLANKIGIAKKPDNISWSDIFGAGLLAGIGFTMSIFVAFLAFNNPTEVDSAKGAIICASVLAATIGSIIIAKKGGK